MFTKKFKGMNVMVLRVTWSHQWKHMCTIHPIMTKVESGPLTSKYDHTFKDINEIPLRETMADQC